MVRATRSTRVYLCRECHMRIRTRHCDLSRLKRLTQGIKDGALELRQFIEKKDAQMGHAGLTGPGLVPAADQRRHRSAVMRATKRPRPADAPAFKGSSHASHHGCFQCLGRCQFGKNAGQTTRHQRLARTRRSDHQPVGNVKTHWPAPLGNKPCPAGDMPCFTQTNRSFTPIYARVSSSGQSLEVQQEQLKDAGCEEIFAEKRSGGTREGREELDRAIKFCRKGDMPIKTRHRRRRRAESLPPHLSPIQLPYRCPAV